MHTRGFRLFAITSMLALLFGGDVCMLVNCSSKQAGAAAATHECCATPGAEKSPAAPSPHESSKPCCIQVTIASAPALEPPAVLDTHALATLCLAATLAATPRVATAPSPPGDAASPPPSPLLAAFGSRAPPRSS